MRVIIDIDKDFEDVTPPGVSKAEYEESVKNGMVLVMPDIHPPDVEVEVEK